MSAPIPWTYRATPANATRDARGYLIEASANFDESTWLGRRWRALEIANEKNAEIQRRMGYQVYEGDPGRPPWLMSHYEQMQASRHIWDWCNIL